MMYHDVSKYYISLIRGGPFKEELSYLNGSILVITFFRPKVRVVGGKKRKEEMHLN